MREEILKRQNEDQMLKIQYSARGCYNRAEQLGNMAWVCCAISAVSLIIPESVPVGYQIIAPIIFDILALLLSKMQDDSVGQAAEFRAYFDAYVLGINDNYKQHERDRIIGDAIEYCEKHIKKSEVEIKNTGFDNPPGVRDWYDLKASKENTSSNEVIFECQKQNAWWDERLSKKRIKLLSALSAILLIAVIAIIILANNYIVIRIVLSSALIVKAIERVMAEHKYIVKSNIIDGAISVMRDKPNTSSIEELQKMINEKRRCNVVGINMIHKRNANPLSRIYQSRRNG